MITGDDVPLPRTAGAELRPRPSTALHAARMQCMHAVHLVAATAGGQQAPGSSRSLDGRRREQFCTVKVADRPT